MDVLHRIENLAASGAPITLPAGASEDQLRRAEVDLERGLPGEIRALLTRWNGPTVFGVRFLSTVGILLNEDLPETHSLMIAGADGFWFWTGTGGAIYAQEDCSPHFVQVADSLEEFLQRLIDGAGQSFWDHAAVR